MEVVEKGTHSLKNAKQILEHTTHFPFRPFEWENGACKCVNIGGRCDSNCMDFKNVGMWILNNTTTIKDESCKTHPNKTDTI